MKHKSLRDTNCNCTNMVGRYPEGAFIPSAVAKSITQKIYVGRQQACSINIKNGYMYICPYTTVGAKQECSDYRSKLRTRKGK